MKQGLSTDLVLRKLPSLMAKMNGTGPSDIMVIAKTNVTHTSVYEGGTTTEDNLMNGNLGQD